MSEEYQTDTAQVKFAGFSLPNYTGVPDEFFDELMPDLTGAEMKVVLYITRRTLGFKKRVDSISESQMLHGIQKKDGTPLDRGTGLSRGALRPAIRALLKRNVIWAKKKYRPNGSSAPTEYALVFQGEAIDRTGSPPQKPRTGWTDEEKRSLAGTLLTVSQSRFGNVREKLLVDLWKASGGASAAEICRLLELRYSEGYRPDNDKGPRGWGWYEATIRNHFSKPTGTARESLAPRTPQTTPEPETWPDGARSGPGETTLDAMLNLFQEED